MCDRLACKVATEMFKNNFNCAESLLSGIAAELGVESDVIPRVASGFGAGVSRHGGICGALSGAIMGLGLKFGRSTPDDDAKAAMYDMTGELWTKFEEEFGTAMCKELTSCDMMTPEGMAEFSSKGLHSNLCMKFVVWAVEEAMKYVDASS